MDKHKRALEIAQQSHTNISVLHGVITTIDDLYRGSRGVEHSNRFAQSVIGQCRKEIFRQLRLMDKAVGTLRATGRGNAQVPDRPTAPAGIDSAWRALEPTHKRESNG